MKYMYFNIKKKLLKNLINLIFFVNIFFKMVMDYY